MIVDGQFVVSGWEDDLEDIDPSRNPEEKSGKCILKAAEQGQLEMLKTLLKRNPALIQTKDKDGYTPLQRACYGNYVDVVRFLLEEGADMSSKTDVNWGPLHSCCHWNNKECGTVLIQWGADVNSESEGGQTPLHIAAVHGTNYDLVQVLLVHPYIDHNKLSNVGDTPRNIAQRCSKFYNIFDVADPLLSITKLDLLQ